VEGIAAEIPILATMSYADIPDNGLLLDGSAWAGLPFAEARRSTTRRPAASRGRRRAVADFFFGLLRLSRASSRASR